MLLQTPQSTANETCTLDLGWETIQTHLDIRLLKYRARIAEGMMNGTNRNLLNSCIKAQKEANLNYERSCQEVLQKIQLLYP